MEELVIIKVRLVHPTVSGGAIGLTVEDGVGCNAALHRVDSNVDVGAPKFETVECSTTHKMIRDLEPPRTSSNKVVAAYAVNARVGPIPVSRMACDEEIETHAGFSILKKL